VNGLHALTKFQKKTVGLIGDVILDTYTFGQTKRVSPEAPVPVLSVVREEKKAGGAGNVALNLLSLGMHVKLMARVGSDRAGDEVLDLLSKSSVDCTHLLCDSTYTTSVKNRFIASSQQLLRVDNEKADPLSEEQENLFCRSLDAWLKDVDIVAISDYAKGLLTDRLLFQVITKAKASGKIVIVDPKGVDFRKYKGAHIIKPNYQEALLAVPQSERTLEKAALWIQDSIDVAHVMITRSEDGISLFSKREGFRHFPVHSREVRDGTGAGDTVLAFLAAALASDLTIEEAVPLANTFASIGIERLGCAVISLHDLAGRLLDQNPTGKIISWNAFEIAQSAFVQKELYFHSIPSSHGLQIETLKQLRSGTRTVPPSGVSIALIQEEDPEEHSLELIAGFDSIRWVVWGAKLGDVKRRFPSAQFMSFSM
jgi:D-beta-D-heptose 7-phosphate kinase/D-beta-D-heptose 1-phosphate adenosyltransferase